jgi:hypothetical protein
MTLSEGTRAHDFGSLRVGNFGVGASSDRVIWAMCASFRRLRRSEPSAAAEEEGGTEGRADMALRGVGGGAVVGGAVVGGAGHWSCEPAEAGGRIRVETVLLSEVAPGRG